jgi:hypothetical protein
MGNDRARPLTATLMPDPRQVVHIAMKLFPPQMDITSTARSGGWAICGRWKAAQDDPSTVRKPKSGVDLLFPEHAVAEYRDAAADIQLKWDASIETWINERLQGFGARGQVGAGQAVETWAIPWDRSPMDRPAK